MLSKYILPVFQQDYNGERMGYFPLNDYNAAIFAAKDAYNELERRASTGLPDNVFNKGRLNDFLTPFFVVALIHIGMQHYNASVPFVFTVAQDFLESFIRAFPMYRIHTVNHVPSKDPGGTPVTDIYISFELVPEPINIDRLKQQLKEELYNDIRKDLTERLADSGFIEDL